MEQGITTSVLNGANAPERRGETVVLPEEEEALMHDGHDDIVFTHHRQAGQREVVRGLPADLKTSPLGPRRSGRRGE